MRRYCGRDFSAAEVDRIRAIIAAHPQHTRTALSVLVCEALRWYKADGETKQMSCRVAMLRMEKDGEIELPPPRRAPRRRAIEFTAQTDPGEPVTAPVHELSRIRLSLVIGNTPQSRLWNEWIERYHYLGYQPMPGAQLRYFVRIDERVVAVLGFGPAAWKTAPRDRFIGWQPQQREKNLPRVVNNARFLILPWVQSPNLASHILARVSKVLPHQWYERYKIHPVLLESFVERERFRGTCYRAANWIHVGHTTGRGKCSRSTKPTLPVKDIWLYPLTRDFRRQLTR